MSDGLPKSAVETLVAAFNKEGCSFGVLCSFTFQWLYPWTCIPQQKYAVLAAFQMEKRGIRTKRGDINRAVDVTNNQLWQLRARIRKCKDWLYSQPLTGAPSMMDMMNGISGGQNLKSRWRKITDLQTQAKVFIFLQSNHITDISQLADTVTKIHERFYEVSNKIKAAERRLNTLTEHLTQYKIYKQHSAVYKKYKQLDRRSATLFMISTARKSNFTNLPRVILTRL